MSGAIAARRQTQLSPSPFDDVPRAHTVEVVQTQARTGTPDKKCSVAPVPSHDRTVLERRRAAHPDFASTRCHWDRPGCSERIMMKLRLKVEQRLTKS